MDDSAIICYEVVDATVYAEAKSNDEAKWNDEETKTNFNEKEKQSVKHKISIFCLHFY